jgi:SAM-dependent methyltransferase
MNSAKKTFTTFVARYRSRKARFPEMLSLRIPPYRINYNYDGPRWKYRINFLRPAIRDHMAEILRTLAAEGKANQPITFFDVGCGLGPMAAAFMVWAESMDESSSGKCRYLGLDIRNDSIDWLRKSYSDDPRFEFVLHRADATDDYVHAELTRSTTKARNRQGESAGVYQLSPQFKHDVQWSSSLFTHVTPETAFDILRSVSMSAQPGGIQFNTWLLVDEESEYAMEARVSDRLLSIDMGAYKTYSESNPLMCTAYKSEFVQDLYRQAGLEVVRVDRGSWRGLGQGNPFGHYQDVIVSRKAISR